MACGRLSRRAYVNDASRRFYHAHVIERVDQNVNVIVSADGIGAGIPWIYVGSLIPLAFTLVVQHSTDTSQLERG